MKTADLEGALLDYWVARATGMGCWDWSDGTKVTFADWQKHHSLHTRFTKHSMEAFRPSTDWAQGGPIIDRESISIYRDEYRDASGRWKGYGATMPRSSGGACGSGSTHLIAAMRAFVASKFGDEVPDLPA